MALLFTVYGEERNTQDAGEEGRINAGLGLAGLSLCGRGGLNLTPDSGRPVNSYKLDSEVKLPSVGICFLSAEQPWKDRVSV